MITPIDKKSTSRTKNVQTRLMRTLRNFFPRITPFRLWLLLLLLLLAFLSFETYRYPSITIEPISLPREFATLGYTPKVAARRLLDNILAVFAGNLPSLQVPIKSNLNQQDYTIDKLELIPEISAGILTQESTTSAALAALTSDSSEALDVIIPVIDLPIRTVAAYLQNVFRFRPSFKLRGEILYDDESDNLSLRLRLNNTSLEDSHSTLRNNNPDDVFQLGARHMIKSLPLVIFAKSPVRLRVLLLQGYLYLVDGEIDTAGVILTWR